MKKLLNIIKYILILFLIIFCITKYSTVEGFVNQAHKRKIQLVDPFKYDQLNYYQKRRDPIDYDTSLDDYGKMKKYRKKYTYPDEANSEYIMPIVAGELIALWNRANRRFMRMNSNGTVDSCCQHSKKLPPSWTWEIWLVVDGGGGNICLWNPKNRRFARMWGSKVNSCCQIEPENLPALNKWPLERWKVTQLENNQISLWNPHSQRYARMNSNGTVDSCCKKVSLPDSWTWERWEIVNITTYMGCWNDRPSRAIPNASIYGYNNSNYKNKKNAIQECAQFAYSRGFKYFAVQDGGWCATGPNVINTYRKYGLSKKCSNTSGKGGPWSNSVYKIDAKNMLTDCQLSNWSNWSSCSGNCIGGTQTRRKRIIVQPRFGGKSCPKSYESRNCSSRSCGPVYVLGNYGMGPWGSSSIRYFGGSSRPISQWIWNIPSAASNAPVGITIPFIKIHYSRGNMRLGLNIAADDAASVYINGRYIGYVGGGWGGKANKLYCTAKSGKNVFTFNSRNGGGPAGLAVYAYNRDNGAVQFITDSSWKVLR